MLCIREIYKDGTGKMAALVAKDWMAEDLIDGYEAADENNTKELVKVEVINLNTMNEAIPGWERHT